MVPSLWRLDQLCLSFFRLALQIPGDVGERVEGVCWCLIAQLLRQLLLEVDFLRGCCLGESLREVERDSPLGKRLDCSVNPRSRDAHHPRRGEAEQLVQRELAAGLVVQVRVTLVLEVILLSPSVCYGGNSLGDEPIPEGRISKDCFEVESDRDRSRVCFRLDVFHVVVRGGYPFTTMDRKP